jgi:excisionase family DNA binding protein
MNTSEHRLAYSIGQASTRTGLSRTTIYALIKSGKIEARKSGRRTLILSDALDAFLSQLARRGQGGQ